MNKLLVFFFLPFFINLLPIQQTLSESSYSIYDPFFLYLTFSSDSNNDPECQVSTLKITNKVTYSIYLQKKPLNLIQIENISYIVYKEFEIGIYLIENNSFEILKIPIDNNNTVFIDIFNDDKTLFVIYDLYVVIISIINRLKPDISSIKQIDLKTKTVISTIKYNQNNCFYYINDLISLNNFCFDNDYNISISLKIVSPKISELIYKYYKEYPIFQFTDILIEENLLLLSEKQYGIFGLDINDPRNITLKGLETISDIKKMYIYFPKSIKKTNKTLVVWLEDPSRQYQNIKEYNFITDNFQLRLLKETKIKFFIAKDAVLSGNYLILAQDNLVKLYRPGIPSGMETFELNNIDFDSILMIKNLPQKGIENSFIIVHPDRIGIYNLKLSFNVLCNNLENIDGNYILNYEFQTLNCNSNMSYVETNSLFFCEFKVTKSLEGGRNGENNSNKNKDALIIGLTVGLFGLIIILSFVCCYLRKLKKKYEILESNEIKNTKRQYQESEKEIIDNKNDNVL